MIRPNILIINSDQHRVDSLGCYGHDIVKTPNLDRLAAMGMRFDNAFTPAPLCCPARQSLLCSQVPEKHGCLWNYGTGSGHAMGGLPPETDVWPRRLRQAGYRTAYFPGNGTLTLTLVRPDSASKNIPAWKIIRDAVRPKTVGTT